MPEPRNPTRIATLDGLRGIAIVLVLLHHYVQQKLPLSAGWPHYLDQLLTLTWSGVDLFFVLSGFLIGGLLLDHRESPRLPKVFYLRRACRILPLYYGTLLVLYGWFHIGRYSKLPQWTYLTFTSNHAMGWLGVWDIGSLSVLWSLAVEEQFYLVAPWVIRWTRPALLPRILLGAVILAWLCRLGARWFDHSGISSHVLMPCRMDAFAFGMLAAWATRSETARTWIARNLPDGWVPLLVAAPPLVLLIGFKVRFDGWQLPLYGYTCLGIFYASLVYIVVVRTPPRLVALLSWRPLVNLGRLSYFVYLWHTLVLAVLARRVFGQIDFAINSLPAVGMILLATGVTWGLAWISWKFSKVPWSGSASVMPTEITAVLFNPPCN